MDRKTATRLEDISLLMGMISGFVFLLTTIFFLISLAHNDFAGVALIVAVPSAGLFVISMILYFRVQPALEAQFVEHAGPIASVGQTKGKDGVITFEDGYVVELDFVIEVKPGSHLTVWRDGWDHLKRIEVKQAGSGEVA